MIRYLQREIEKLIIISILHFLYYTKNYLLVELTCTLLQYVP